MRYIPEAKALFVHIPRTGGEFVERALEICGIETEKWEDAHPRSICTRHPLPMHLFPKRLAEVEVMFSFIRSPIDYYESVWKWMTKFGPKKRPRLWRWWKWHPHRDAGLTYRPVFSDWVLEMTRCHPAWVSRLYDMYLGPPTGPIVHHVGLTQSVASDFVRIMGRIGIDVGGFEQRLLATGKINAVDIPTSWTNEAENAVRNLEKEAFDRCSRLLKKEIEDENCGSRVSHGA